MTENSAFYIVQLQITHLLDVQCNVPLTRVPLAIAESLVLNSKQGAMSALSGLSTWAVNEVGAQLLNLVYVSVGVFLSLIFTRATLC